MPYDPHTKPATILIADKHVTLPSGKRMEEKSIIRMCNRVLNQPDGQILLDYLEYKALSNTFQDLDLLETRASYILGRREFYDLIKKLSR